jgi:hypothetical protein
VKVGKGLENFKNFLKKMKKPKKSTKKIVTVLPENAQSYLEQLFQSRLNDPCSWDNYHIRASQYFIRLKSARVNKIKNLLKDESKENKDSRSD